MEKQRAIIARRLNAAHPLGKDTDVVIAGLRSATEEMFASCAEFAPPTDENHYLVSGWLAYVRDLPSGKRAFIELVLQGERIANFGASVRCLCLSPVVVAKLERPFDRDVFRHPGIATAIEIANDQRYHFMMQHCIRLGGMDAVESFANLLCEVHYRQSQILEVSNDTFHFPIQQGQVSNLLGFTQAHLNPVYKQLADEGLAQHTLHQKRVAVFDLKSLSERGHFAPPSRQRQLVRSEPAVALQTAL
ncbi:MAG: Crp/Fnr family transcriptional regulator [Burkholderiales bacterium]|nr:MAG: Crp/Fnr family transcriptional regulator [Burkholderiales bacterium]